MDAHPRRGLAEYLNRLEEASLRAVLARCCVSRGWIEGMAARRPFAADEQVLAAAAGVWQGLGRDDWREAFAGHPPIGDLASLQAKYAGTQPLAAREQAGMLTASEQTLRRLAEGNRAYKDKFGHIFIVCATGKSADEMLALLEARIGNHPATELPIAAEEQLKITQIRLQGLAP